ncbi:MAG: sugar phosphate isomerase/epimerase [Acidobacteria bacterium]|nr:sugar phosphate isomerase/epimerase [Acidobacteriota bacterium]
MNKQLNRRTFLTTATQTAAIAFASGRLAIAENNAAAASTQKKLPIQIGILLGTFRTGTIEARLDAAKAAGIEAVQLSMDCAGLPAMPDSIAPELLPQIRSAAASRGIKLASVSGTFNMCHPDAEYRQTGLRRLRVLAEACPQLGISKIHLCTGTRDRTSMWRNHPDNNTPEAWRDMVACVREATEIARQARITLAFEPEVNNVVNSAQKARRLMDEIGSPFLKVTLDAANLFPAGKLPQMKEILDEAFALIGKDIVLAHAKDLDHDGDAGHLPAGQGKLDYAHYVALLHKHRFIGPLLLHSLSEAQVPGCVAFLREKIGRIASSKK